MESIENTKKFNELLVKLKGLNIIQTKGGWAENLPHDIWEQHFKNNFKEVEHYLDVDTHRWHETSITVIEVYGKFLGVRYITNMFSERQDYEDCHVQLEFFEMKQVQTVSYTEVDKT